MEVTEVSEIQFMDTLLCICDKKIDLIDLELGDVIECQSCGALYEIELHDGMGIPKLIE